MQKIDLKNIDAVTKILLILLAGVIFYLIFFLLLKPFFVPQSSAGMMRMMSFDSNESITINLVALIVTLAVAVIVSLYLFQAQKIGCDEYKILRKALSADEKTIIDEVKKSGEITQDSLRFRLNWSKAKISTILTNLDRMNLIQRERTGKTYVVRLSK